MNTSRCGSVVISPSGARTDYEYLCIQSLKERTPHLLAINSIIFVRLDMFAAHLVAFRHLWCSFCEAAIEPVTASHTRTRHYAVFPDPKFTGAECYIARVVDAYIIVHSYGNYQIMSGGKLFRDHL